MRIEVTVSHLERGIPADPCGCPVALAIGEALAARGIVPDQLAVHFTCICMGLTGETERIRLRTPRVVATFIDGYDHNRRGIGPFAFDLDLGPLGLAGVA